MSDRELRNIASITIAEYADDPESVYMAVNYEPTGEIDNKNPPLSFRMIYFLAGLASGDRSLTGELNAPAPTTTQ